MKKGIGLFFFAFILTATSIDARECNKLPGSGVLPYALNEKGEVKILLAHDNNGYWSSLGGSRKYVHSVNNPKPRCETAQETAVREGWEESRHILTKEMLKSSIPTAKTLPSNPKQSDFITYLVKVELFDLSPYKDVYVVEGSSSAETNLLFWADLRELRKFASGENGSFSTPNNKPLRSVFWKPFKSFLNSQNINVFRK